MPEQQNAQLQNAELQHDAPVNAAADAGESWMTQETYDLAAAVAALESRDEALRFLRDLCTVRELQELGQRWHVARLLAEGVPYHQISEQTGASSATVSRVNQWLRYGRSGYRTLIDRMERR
jgi:TrpR-related protein YerC/YecD